MAASEACLNCIVCRFLWKLYLPKTQNTFIVSKFILLFSFFLRRRRRRHTLNTAIITNGVRQFAVKSKSIFHLTSALDLPQFGEGKKCRLRKLHEKNSLFAILHSIPTYESIATENSIHRYLGVTINLNHILEPRIENKIFK